MRIKHISEELQKDFKEKYGKFLTTGQIEYLINSTFNLIKEKSASEKFVIDKFGSFTPYLAKERLCSITHKVLPEHYAVRFKSHDSYRSLVRYRNN